MKISLLAVAAVHATEKKVPPRHPLNRLAKLGTFYEAFADEYVRTQIGDGAADRFTARMENFLDNMKTAFERPNCGYYDDSTKHGGPDPNPDQRENGTPRNRRDDDGDDSVDSDITSDEVTLAWCAEPERDTSSDAWLTNCCCADSTLEQCAGVTPNCSQLGKRTGGGKAYDRLASNGSLKWKQITTGTRKWAERYINNCSGQRKNQHASNRAKKLYKTWSQKLTLE